LKGIKMAESTITPTPDPSLPTGTAGDGLYKSLGSLIVNAGDYEAGGILLNFLQSGIKAQRVPLRVTIRGTSGYEYSYVKGTDASNGLVKIFVQDATAGNPLAELADDAVVPAGVLADTITYEAYWRGML
jgi:hypothetical protein